ncbi:hypothetical protein [Allofranklinella schreckenbergeri]|uniref:hypothetical protein n=1 Tax=Allofranklinella schreckenbergeri TaxID=1076744 RepID=UPI0011C4942D|nr:hypothetical protein [Allofranklinella schreckenbergeri]
MKKSLHRLALVIALIAGLWVALLYVPSGYSWLVGGLWLGLIFVALPLLLLCSYEALGALLASRRARRAGASPEDAGGLLLHVCAAFALAVGALVAWMARGGAVSAMPVGWLMLILPALVYVLGWSVALQRPPAQLLLYGLRKLRQWWRSRRNS